jgi:hypothetical protein
MTMVCLVMKVPAAEPRNTAAPAISSGSPIRNSGAADAARGAGDDGDFSRQVQQGRARFCQTLLRRRMRRLSFQFRA